MWKQRLHKEVWTKEELKNFGIETDAAGLRERYGISEPERQKMYMSKFFPQGKLEAGDPDNRSQWSRIEPDPKA